MVPTGAVVTYQEVVSIAVSEVTSGICYFRGRFVPLAEANVSITTHAFSYGTSVFEGIRAYWNEGKQELYMLKAPEHFRRLHQSCRIMKMELPHSVDDLLGLARELMRRNNWRQDVWFRPMVFKATQTISVTLNGLRDEFCMYGLPLGDYLPTTGLSCQVSAWRRLPDNAIPSRGKIGGSYVNSALAADSAKADGYDDAIVLGDDGQVAEGSAANLFLVRGGTLVTTPVTADILEGITRIAVTEVARALEIPVEVRPIDRTELYTADELFFCGTGIQVAPITRVDRRPVGSGAIGPVASRIQQTYFQAVRGNDPRFSHWLTPVYNP